MQNKKPFEIILHVGRDASLQSWVAIKSCHGQTLECFIFDYPSNFELILTTYVDELVEIFLKLSTKLW